MRNANTLIRCLGILAAAIAAGCSSSTAPIPASETHIVHGIITGWEIPSRCAGPNCAVLPLLRIRVITSFTGTWRDEIVLQMLLPGSPYQHPDSIQNGDEVVVTFEVDTQTDAWSCGALLPCDTKPVRVLRGIDVFRRLRIPT